MRVVGADSEQLGIMSLQEALALAEARQLDLVEVSPTAVPPVCRIMDYGKFKYQQAKKLQEAKKKQAQAQLKEIKLRPKIADHDFSFKMRKVQEFLEEHNRVKITVQFRGREIAYAEFGQQLLTRVMGQLGEVATVVSEPKQEGRFLIMIVAPK